MSVIVTPADLEYGWNCEACGHPFTEGDVAYGELTGFHGDTIVEENWVCTECREATT